MRSRRFRGASAVLAAACLAVAMIGCSGSIWWASFCADDDRNHNSDPDPEMCWTADDHPVEAQDFFDSVYPDIRGVDEVREVVRDAGYMVIGDFKLPDRAWWDDYYTPMLSRIEILRSKNAGIAEAEAVYAHLERESHMRRQHGASYGYVFFVLQKP